MKSGHAKNSIQSDIDWETIRHRLEQARQAIDALSEPDPARQQQILRERSLDFARAAGTEEPVAAAPNIEVLSFKCAGERYAFETRYVARVCPMCPITPIPGTPDFITGIISVSGDVLSVLDLRVLLNLPLSLLADPVSIIVLKNQNMEFGVLAEEIIGTERYPLHTLERGLPMLTDSSETYLTGVTVNRTAILNADQLLCDPRMLIEIN